MPTALNLLMLLAVVGTLVIMGVVTASVLRPGPHAAVVIISAVIFGATLLLIRDFDQPYSGITGRDPDQTYVRAQPDGRRAPRPAAVRRPRSAARHARLPSHHEPAAVTAAGRTFASKTRRCGTASLAARASFAALPVAVNRSARSSSRCSARKAPISP
ncbi:MAG TPA: hypothetical protein VES62_08375 [Thermoleophilaceae bacterium]|nr:hypothetical protein [Thermoleophilaceae bacterium]